MEILLVVIQNIITENQNRSQFMANCFSIVDHDGDGGDGSDGGQSGVGS